MLDIVPIKAFNDNYLWVFKAKNSNQACIVDPGDANAVLHFLKTNKLCLAAIFITHHHADHTGGIKGLLEVYDVPVYGPDSANIPSITQPLHEGDTVNIFDEVFTVIEIPGHTMDHIAYFTDNNDPVLFCGDTLFAGGCGRVFEGTYAMMHQSLQKLADLTPQTQVFCAHEYTLANLAFASAVNPDDLDLSERIDQEQKKRNNDIATVPTSIEKELKTNPFLRCDDKIIKAAAENKALSTLANAEEVFATLRQWKDSF